MVVMLQSNVQATNHTYALMESALVTKTSVKFKLHALMIDHLDVKIKHVQFLKQNVIQYLFVLLINQFFVHQEYVLRILMNVRV